ncbi:hypothetical protein G6F46_000520 [Rhizopus delemar]|nr:hypothetical protein G6F55_000202 [Rhizopus delemar]KAG1637315.1 hypothetical protein G6F45_000647 [Rhizopus arrhizus]KAG1504672.1 hypothetical protein G6F54_000847 [Rhizopus delemar]KAG1575527.1 hypothetical protein G6F50_001018 [Rhizopus delemar]KAG1605194.1 hypothetical protein G6F47_000218 [Rhizopus delemar]
MNTRLAHDATKINPKFEGYKLQPCIDITNISRTDLSEGGIQLDSISIKDHHRLGFRDLQARIRQSHLFYGYPLDENRSSSFIIDKEYQVHMVLYDKSTKTSQFHFISQLIKPLGSVPSFTEPDSRVPIESQSSSIVAISHELILASNGVGDIELIGIEEKDGKILGASLGSVCYMGKGDEGIQPVPCYLLTARRVKGKIILVVYSRAASKNTEFNIATLEIEIPTEHTPKHVEDGSFELYLKTLHIQIGPEVPVYCAITPSGERCILGSETKYNRVHPKIEAVEEEETPMEVDSQDEKEPLYKWSQEGQDITVWIQLPPNTPKSSINCKFIHDHLSLIVQDTPITFPFRKLWSTVRVDECVWTLDANRGLLTLFMSKVDENTRWPQLFDKDDGVLETLSAIELSEISQKLVKFTSEDSEQQYLKAAQHPAATDMDEDIDEAGQPVVFSVYDTLGNEVEEFSSGAYRWISQSFDAFKSLPSICLQMDVDGIVYELSEGKDHSIQIKHTATFDAFAFVKASKRDARYILHDPSLFFTCVIESTRNAYIYFHHDDKRLFETQTLVDLTLGDKVDVVGAQLVMKNTLMVLTEAHVIVIELLL